MPRRHSPYGGRYESDRAALLAQGLPCALRLVCHGAPADSADHDPPLGLHEHLADSGCCRLQPACMACQRLQSVLVRELRRNRKHLHIPQPSRQW
jgi:hypothetical protein